MKSKYLKILSSLVVCSGLTMTSCSDFLDKEPYANIPSADFYKTQNDMELAAVGLYGTLQDFYRTNYPEISELPADNTQDGTGATTATGQFDKFSIITTNSVLQSAWINAYNSILQTNLMLESLPNIVFKDENKKLQIKGEALFVRALNYFNLVRMFGKVPLVTKVQTQQEARHSIRNEESDIYALIINDLDSAAVLLPESYAGSDIGRATKFAALSLLGKVYLTMGEFAEAVTPLQTVISSGRYTLLTDYAAIFDPKNANHAESIFEIQYEGGTLGEGSAWSCKAHNTLLANVLGISSRGTTMPTTDLINTFQSDTVGETNSPRFLASMGKMNYSATASAWHVKKHYMELSTQNSADDNWPLIRYADVLLMYAEAINEISTTPPSDAVEYVNQIRRRAFGLPITGSDKSKDLSDLQTATQGSFRNAIYLERRLELAFEGHRWFDLVRTGQYVSVMNKYFTRYNSGLYTVKNYHKYYPVPQRELDINPLLKPNNDGY